MTSTDTADIAGFRPAPGARQLVVGTRGSDLALWQTHWVIEQVRAHDDAARLVVQTIKTQGDRTQALNVPLAQLGDKGVFVAELEHALLAGSLDVAIHTMHDRALADADRARQAGAAARQGVDVAVHSLKDLPSTLTDGLVLAAITERDDPRDVLASRHGLALADLPHAATVATSSLRRRAQLLHLRPDLRVVEIRGNVDTRLRKALAPDGPDAVLLAAAGMKRLGLAQHITEYLPVDIMIPAVGQGALAVEVRQHDTLARRLLSQIDSPATRRAVLAERAVLATLGGGCQVPLGAHAVLDATGMTLRLHAVVASPDGVRLLRAVREGPANRPVALGRQVARDLRKQGADDILRAVLAR